MKFSPTLNVDEPLGQLSNTSRALPGCRPCGLNWAECQQELRESQDGVNIALHLDGIEWTREVKKTKGDRLQCNLQELEVLRWIAEGDAPGAAEFLNDYGIDYQPRRRYSCLFPHPAGSTHDVLEILPGMTASELQDIGKEALRQSLVLLCPVPASLCAQTSHTSVREEVYQLATFWPLRQVLDDAAADGMVDIGPVTLCRNHPTEDCCILFDTGREEVLGPQTRIKFADADVQRVTEIAHRGRNNPQIALHDSWHTDIQETTQPAVLRCQRKKAMSQPTRLYDSYERTIKCGIRPHHYLALSYCWAEWPEEKEYALRDEIGELSQRLGIRYFWVDRWCIKQDDESDKAMEIPRMKDYYMGASACMVLAGPSVKPFGCVPRHDGAILSAYQQLMQNKDGISSLMSCPWASRVWTLQEAMMAQQVIYAVGKQLIDGDYISELVAYASSFPDIYTGDPQQGTEWIGGYGSYRWNARAPSVVPPGQFMMRDGGRRLTIRRTPFGGEQLFSFLQSMDVGVLLPLEEAFTMTRRRLAAVQDDYIYGILGISQGGHRVNVEYNIGWRVMLDKLKEAGLLTDRLLAAPTANKVPELSWLPAFDADSTESYAPFENMERLASFMLRPKLSWSGRAAVVFGAVFEWVESEYYDEYFINIRGLGCSLGWVQRARSH